MTNDEMTAIKTLCVVVGVIVVLALLTTAWYGWR
jgi:hypothetical protein